MPQVMKLDRAAGIIVNSCDRLRTRTSKPKMAPARGMFRVAVKPAAIPQARGT